MSVPVDESLHASVLNHGEVFSFGLQTTILSQTPSFSVVVATATREPSAAMSFTGCCVRNTRIAPVEEGAAARTPPLEVDAATATARRTAATSQDLLMTSFSHNPP